MYSRCCGPARSLLNLDYGGNNSVQKRDKACVTDRPKRTDGVQDAGKMLVDAEKIPGMMTEYSATYRTADAALWYAPVPSAPNAANQILGNMPALHVTS